jgi:hypothetical protein
MPQGKGMRCFGFLSEDGEYAHCSREDHAGEIESDQASTYPHKLHGKCACGVQHGEDIEERRPVNLSKQRLQRTGEARRAPDIEYEYRDEANRLVGVKGRWNIPATVAGEKADKDIAWRMPQGTYSEGLRKYGMSVEQMPLYNAHKLAQLPKGSIVYFVEGEKTADACESAGLVDWQKTGVTSNAGGSAQTKFGESLSAIEGFHLRPWPDNDPQGRKLMRALRPLVEQRCLSWRPVLVSVPEGGDAYDFFFPDENSGYDAGTVEQVVSQALVKPTTERLDEETIRVTAPTTLPETRAVFTFSEIERQRRKLVCVVQTQVLGLASISARKTLQYDIDVLSISAVDNYRKMLDKAYTPEHDWHDVLTTAVSEMRTAWSSSTGEVDGVDIDASEGDELLMACQRILPWGEHVVIYGRRDSTKSYEVLTLVCSASLGLPFAGMPTNCEGTWLYIDNETNERNFGRRLRRIWRGMGFEPGSYPRGRVLYKNARGRSVPDLFDDLKPRIDELGIVGIVVDSAVLACGGDPLDSLAVAHYFAMCDRFQRTMITIAHVPKPDKENARPPTDPFGSTVWSNKARACWRVDRQSHSEGESRVNVMLTCTKGNDLPDKRPLFMEVCFEEDNGPVSVRQKRANEAPRELQQNLTLIQRIWNVLQRGALTAYDIAAILNENAIDRVEAKTIKDTCYRHTLPDARPRLVALDNANEGGRGLQTRYARAEIAHAPASAQRQAVGQNTTPAAADDDDLPL